MCLILFSFRHHSRYQLVMAANRDEFLDRPTASADFWEDDPNVLAGRDLKAGGTWLGITKTGRIAALTNFRNPSLRNDNAPSRGRLVSDFLKGSEKPLEYVQRLMITAHNYNHFNLLLGDLNQIYSISNLDETWHTLEPGIYGLSNHLLDTPWPKVTKGREELSQVLSAGKKPFVDRIFEILTDNQQPDDRFLPDTGVGLEWERILSPIFVTGPAYGTRSSVVLLIDIENNVYFVERTYHTSDRNLFEEKKFEFRL